MNPPGPTSPPSASGSWDPEAFPVALLRPYDHLDATGNHGYTLDRLLREVRRDGVIREPLHIGYSAAQVAAGDRAIYVFDGQHRLEVARRLGISHVPVRSAWRSEDALPVDGIPCAP